MISPIYKYGAAVLRKKTDELNSGDNIREISDTLFESLKKAGGIGLAAPQIGISKRAFVIDTTSLEEEDLPLLQKIYINPQIIEYSADKSYFSEGCLSIPGIFEDVLRPASVRVVYCDEAFKQKDEWLNGTLARIFQHELDHLNGILFTDKLSPLKRRLLAGKLHRISK